MLKRPGWFGILVLGVVIGLVAGGAVVWASIPDSTTGTITACYPTSGTTKGVLRVIDSQAGARCNSGEAMLTWGSSHCCGYPRGGVDWHGCDFRNVFLAGQYLSSANLVGANFTGANLKSATITGTNLTNALLTNASLSAAAAAGATFTGANLTNTLLGGIFTGTRTNLTGAIGLTSAQIKAIRVTAVLNNPCGAYSARGLGSVDFTKSNLSGWDLSKSDVEESLFSSTTLTSANLASVHAFYTVFKNANLTGANMTCDDFYSADLTSANLTNANLKSATNMKLATVTGVVWNNTTCPDGTNSNNDGNTCVGHL